MKFHAFFLALFVSLPLFAQDSRDSAFLVARDAFRAGDRVQQGQVIGYVGDTGNARGGPTHLHFEMHPGDAEPVNPFPTLQAAGWLSHLDVTVPPGRRITPTKLAAAKRHPSVRRASASDPEEPIAILEGSSVAPFTQRPGPSS